jgi:hypothetical protein
MGHYFKYIDDIEVVKRTIGRHFVEIKEHDDILVDDQHGDKYICIDDMYELIPIDHTEIIEGIGHLAIGKSVRWLVYKLESSGGGYWEPPYVEEVEMATSATLPEAMTLVIQDAMKLEIDGYLETLYYEDLAKFESLHPEEA